jgi:hypothetical protein
MELTTARMGQKVVAHLTHLHLMLQDLSVVRLVRTKVPMGEIVDQNEEIQDKMRRE